MEKRTEPRSFQLKCPWCQSMDTRLEALFGDSLLSSRWYCTQCRSVFDGVRWTPEPSNEPK